MRKAYEFKLFVFEEILLALILVTVLNEIGNCTVFKVEPSTAVVIYPHCYLPALIKNASLDESAVL